MTTPIPGRPDLWTGRARQEGRQPTPEEQAETAEKWKPEGRDALAAREARARKFARMQDWIRQNVR